LWRKLISGNMDKIEEMNIQEGCLCPDDIQGKVNEIVHKVHELVDRVNELQDALEVKPKDILVIYTPDTMSMAQCVTMAESKVTQELKAQYTVVFCTSRIVNDVTFELIKPTEITLEELDDMNKNIKEFNQILKDYTNTTSINFKEDETDKS